MGSAKGWRGACAPFPFGSAYYLRDLDRLLSTTWHPDTLAWETHSIPWIEQIIAEAAPQDRERLTASARDAVWWACLCFPATIDEGRMLDIVRMSILYIVIDDLLNSRYLPGDEVRRVIGDFKTAVLSPGRAQTFIGRSLAQAWTDMSARMSERQRARWVAATRHYMRGAAAEVTARAAAEEFSQAAYEQVRKDSMATEIIYLLCEHSLGIDISAHIDAAPDVFTDLEALTVRHFLYTNDLLSFRKEYCEDGDYQHSLVYTGVVAGGLSLQESIDRLCTQVEDSERRYLMLCDRILDRDWGTAQSMVHAYLKQLERVMAGSCDYAHVAVHYHGPDFPVRQGGHYIPRRTSGWLVLQPGQTILLDEPPDGSHGLNG